jgi:hypothetical protein
VVAGVTKKKEDGGWCSCVGRVDAGSGAGAMCWPVNLRGRKGRRDT